MRIKLIYGMHLFAMEIDAELIGEEYKKERDERREYLLEYYKI